MKDYDKTKEQLISELEGLRQQITKLMAVETESKQMEKAFIESENKFRKLANLLPQTICQIDTKGNVTFVNANAVDMFGYSIMDLEIGVSIWQMIIPEDRDRAMENLQRILRGEILGGIQYTARRKDGSTFPILVYYSYPVIDKDNPGEERVLNIVVIDITERKRAEDELRQSEERYRNLIENLPVGISIASIDGQLIETNKAIQQMRGYNSLEENLQSQPSDRYYDMKDRDRFLAMIKEKGRVDGLELRLKRKDGSTFWASFTSIPQKTASGEQQIINVIQDITERKLAEDTLRQSEERFRNIIENLPVGIVITDEDGRLLMVNKAVLESRGYDSEEELKRLPVSERYYDLNDRKRFVNLIRQGPVKDFEVRQKRKDGSFFWVSSSSIPRTTASGEVQFINVQQDITERKKAEEELHQSEERLRNLIRNAPVGIIISSPEKHIIDVNEAMLTMHGCRSIEEFVNWPIEEHFYDPKDRERWLAELREKGKTNDFEVRLRNKNGTIFWASFNSIPQKNASGEMETINVIQDITERKRAEEALRESESKAKALIKYAPTGIYEININTSQFVNLNDAICSVTGYSREELFAMGPNALLDDNSRQLFGQRIKQFLAGEKVEASTEYGVRKKDGSIIFITLTTSFPKDGSENVFVIAHDVTDRRLMEEKLRQSEEKLRFMFDSLSQGVSVNDVDGKIIDVNKAKLRMHGYNKKQELIGRNVSELISQKDRGRALQNRKRVIDGGLARNVEFAFLTRDGVEFPVEASSAVLRDSAGNPLGTITISEDITERKRTEDALRQSEERFRNLIENLPLGISITSPNGQTIMVNRAWLTLRGYDSLDDVKRKPASERYYDPKDRERWLALIKEKGAVQDFETQIKRKDGTLLWTSSNAIRQISDSGEQQLISVTQDITERKQAEEREKELLLELNATSRLAMVGEMSAGIAHEINNPLTGVIGFSDLLMKKTLPKGVRKDVEIIDEGARRIASIIDRMLRFARQTRPERTRVDINDIIGTGLDMRSSEFKTNNITVTTDLDPDLPLTFADAGLLQQVFLNIIINAEQAMKSAHGEGNLTVITERNGNNIRVSFKDNGPGIARENLEKIFNPFFTTKEVGQGTGLGLSVSHGVVTQHGGKIYAQSRLGKGATFFVELPILTTDEQLTPAEQDPGNLKSVSQVRILVIDDEPVVQAFVAAVLNGKGHEVEIVNNGNDAMERLETGEYDVILLDMKLPGITGKEIYEHLRKNNKALARKVIIITGDVMGEDTISFISRTKPAYIAKPFDAARLLEEIDRVITR